MQRESRVQRLFDLVNDLVSCFPSILLAWVVKLDRSHDSTNWATVKRTHAHVIP